MIAEPMPDWMKNQIEEDLEPFKEGVTLESIEATMRDVYSIPSGSLAGFVRYVIKDNKVSFRSPDLRFDDARITGVMQVLEELARHVTLPDVVFLSSVWDSYDNPIYLEKTYCPVFTMCKVRGNKFGVLFPEFRFIDYRTRLINDFEWTCERSPWDEKINIAFWRGMTSGGNYSFYGWDFKPRSRLAIFSQEHPDLVDAAFTSPYALDGNIKMWMEKYGLFQPWSYPVEFIKYKHLISVDGNTFASNFWWQLLSNCCVLKSESDYLEWFYKGTQKDVHYVAYELDTSDLAEKVRWLFAHDKEAQIIAENGRAFAKEHLTNEALAVYFYRLLVAYSKLQR